MRVCRLDLGAEVVHVPTRDLLIIHPDLDYADSLGAVAGTLPDLHLDVVVGLVEQVTPRPHRPSAVARVRPVLRVLAASIIAATVVLVGPLAPEAAAAFGPTWEQQMHAMGLTCQREESVAVCVDQAGTVHEVHGYRRDDAALYVLGYQDRCVSVLIFDNARAATKYRHKHPDIKMAGRVAVW